MTMTTRDPDTADLFGPDVDDYGDATPKTLRRMEALADRFALPRSLAWMSDGGAWRPPVDHVLRLTPGMSFEPTAGRVAVVEPIGSRARMLEVEKEILAADPALGSWGRLACFGSMLREDVPHPAVVGLAVSRVGTDRPEGVLIGSRSLSVGEEDGRLFLRYCVSLDFVYVATGARGGGLACHLTAALAFQMGQDVDLLARTMAARGKRPGFVVQIYAEIESDGGLAVAESLARSVEWYGRNMVGKRTAADHSID